MREKYGRNGSENRARIAPVNPPRKTETPGKYAKKNPGVTARVFNPHEIPSL
jgi:hypothetical protein